MQAYRAYIVGQDGRTVGRTEFFCPDDEAAKERARGNSLTETTWSCGGTTAKSQRLKAGGPPTPPFDARKPD